MCEAAAGKGFITPLGTEESKTVERITTPWEAHVTEPEPEKWRFKVGNKTKGSPTQIRFEVVCAIQATKVEFTGEQSIAGTGGTAQGAAPAKLKLEKSASGEVESTKGGATLSGELKLFGYSEGQTLTVKNQ